MIWIKAHLKWFGYGLLIFIAVCYGIITTTKQEVLEGEQIRITEIVEGTQGPDGKPGLGIKSVDVRQVSANAKPVAVYRNQELTLFLPAGQTGEKGEDAQITQAQVNAALTAYCSSRDCGGPQGPKGPKGNTGKQGKQGIGSPTVNIAAAVDQFMRTHVFICTRRGKSFVCVVGAVRSISE